MPKAVSPIWLISRGDIVVCATGAEAFAYRLSRRLARVFSLEFVVSRPRTGRETRRIVEQLEAQRARAKTGKHDCTSGQWLWIEEAARLAKVLEQEAAQPPPARPPVAWVPAAKPVKPYRRKRAKLPLRERKVQILNVLAGSQRPLIRRMISAELGIAEVSVQRALSALGREGSVERPSGPRSGWVITEAGRAALSI